MRGLLLYSSSFAGKNKISNKFSNFFKLNLNNHPFFPSADKQGFIMELSAPEVMRLERAGLLVKNLITDVHDTQGTIQKQLQKKLKK